MGLRKGREVGDLAPCISGISSTCLCPQATSVDANSICARNYEMVVICTSTASTPGSLPLEIEPREIPTRGRVYSTVHHITAHHARNTLRMMQRIGCSTIRCCRNLVGQGCSSAPDIIER